MPDYDKISLVLASLSLLIDFVSLPLIVLQIKQLKREQPAIRCLINYNFSAYIDPLETNLGNECSAMVSLTLLNTSASAIEITELNLEFSGNTWSCLKDTSVLDREFKFRILNSFETTNPKYTGLKFPFRLEPYSSVEGTVIFPYITLEDVPIFLNVITPSLTVSRAIRMKHLHCFIFKIRICPPRRLRKSTLFIRKHTTESAKAMKTGLFKSHILQ